MEGCWTNGWRRKDIYKEKQAYKQKDEYRYSYSLCEATALKPAGESFRKTPRKIERPTDKRAGTEAFPVPSITLSSLSWSAVPLFLSSMSIYPHLTDSKLN